MNKNTTTTDQANVRQIYRAALASSIARETIRQMLADWNGATADQRAAALASATELADRAERRLLASDSCRNCGSRNHYLCNR